jgi:hypothetical protein
MQTYYYGGLKLGSVASPEDCNYSLRRDVERSITFSRRLLQIPRDGVVLHLGCYRVKEIFLGRYLLCVACEERSLCNGKANCLISCRHVASFRNLALLLQLVTPYTQSANSANNDP